MAEEEIVANGIDATTGEYLVPPMTGAGLAALVKGEEVDKKRIGVLKRIWNTLSNAHLGLPYGVDPLDLTKAGWALVIHKDESAEVRAALEPLVAARRAMIGDEARVKVLEYRPGESRAQWLARYGIGAGTVDPTRVPFYLLMAGGPDRLPFSFCRELAVEYAVGILHFETAAEYGQYVTSLIAYEAGQAPPRGKQVTYFATRHRFDAATQMSADKLVKPMASSSDGSPTTAAARGFRDESLWGPDATRDALLEVLTRAEPTNRPTLLFTATHGMGFPSGDKNQGASQGAWLCQDWAGKGSGPVQPAQYFAAADVPAAAQLHGLVGFHFACFGAGTPATDRFSHTQGAAPPTLAPQPFYAALPKALLTHPGGGALGCIGHVERAWGQSIVTAGAGGQLQPFTNAVSRILAGEPLGLALKDFNDRFAAISVSLSGMLEQVGFGATIPDRQLVDAWLQRNDAEGFVLFGDPAARVKVETLR